MGIRGLKRRLVMEDEHWALILSGMGTVEACRMVGIGYKTGYRWRAELGGLGPDRRAEAQQSDRYLSLLERERIAVLRHQGLSMRAQHRPSGPGALNGLSGTAAQHCRARPRGL